MPDIIFPKKNESKFIDIAERLATKEIYFIYPYQKSITDLKNKLKELQKTTKIKLSLGLSASPANILKAKNICNFVITESSGKDQNTMEKLHPNLIFNFELSPKKDKPHYRLSGLNQVLCKLASTNNITIGFSFSELLNALPKRRAILLGRMIQNLKFCKKFGSPTLFASFAKKPFEMRSLKDFDSFKRVLNK